MEIYGYTIIGNGCEIEAVLTATTSEESHKKLVQYAKENWSKFWDTKMPETEKDLLNGFFATDGLTSLNYEPFKSDIEAVYCEGDVVRVKTFHAEVEIKHDDFVFDAPTYDALIDELFEYIDQFGLWHYKSPMSDFTNEEAVFLAYYDGWTMKYEDEDDFIATVSSRLSVRDINQYKNRAIEYGITYYDDSRYSEGQLSS